MISTYQIALRLNVFISQLDLIDTANFINVLILTVDQMLAILENKKKTFSNRNASEKITVLIDYYPVQF